jgi:hypothetical protein
MNIELLRALDAYQKGDWETAHNIAQSKEGTADYDLLHAFLHRAEGDAFNARYWYQRIGLSLPSGTLDEELEELRELFRV